MQRPPIISHGHLYPIFTVASVYSFIPRYEHCIVLEDRPLRSVCLLVLWWLNMLHLKLLIVGLV